MATWQNGLGLPQRSPIMTLTITPIYAALIVLLFLGLSWRVILYRRANRLSLGDTGDKNLLKRMRAQANCAEYAPLALLLMVMSELMGSPAVALHLGSPVGDRTPRPCSKRGR